MKMNPQQIAVLWIGISIAILIGLMPPWTETFHADGIHSERPLGHAPLFDPPAAQSDSPVYGVGLDLGRLGLICGGIAILTAGLIVTLRDRPSGRTARPSAENDGPEQTGSPPPDETAPSTACSASPSRRPPRSRSAGLYWLLMLCGVVIHMAAAYDPDAIPATFLGEVTYGVLTVFLLGTVGSFAGRLVGRAPGAEATGCIFGIAFALFTTLYLTELPPAAAPHDTEEQADEPRWKQAPTVEPAEEAEESAWWEQDPTVEELPGSYQRQQPRQRR